VTVAETGRRRALPALSLAAPVLHVQDISHRFGARAALVGVTFSVMPGEFAVLLGPNGAGKSTLFALLTRLFHATHGKISVHGARLDHHPGQALARLGVVFQQSTLDLDLTVRQNLAYHAALHGMARAEARARATQELARIGLADRMDDKARSLSGGQRRRVEIARALLTRPALLLLDEPSVGLDAASRHLVLEHVRQLCRERGLAALWATHLIDEAVPEARIIVLHQGRVRAAGSTAEILAAAANAADLSDAFARLTAAPQA
jgi:ABC-2 type transport system ATP-binding protein